MNLLFFTSDYAIGLSSLLVQQSIAISRERDINLVCVAGDTEQEDGLTEQMAENNIHLIRIKDMDKHLNFKQLSKKIGQIIEDNEIQFVHVQNNWQLSLLAFYKYKNIFRPKSFKIAYTLHGFRHNYPTRVMFAVVAIGMSLSFFANRVFVMSDYVKKHFFFLGKKMKKLYLGIDDSFFSKTENHVETNPIRLVFPAQFRTGKNQDIIINAIASYIDKTGDTSIELYLPGEGPLLEKYKEMAKDKGIEKNVIFPGQCTKLEIKELYEFCNVGIVSSNTETFGQSIVEPYVLGRCVLTRNVGVAPDIINNGVNGYLFRNKKDLTEILVKLSQNRSKIETIGNNNFENRNTFSWREIVKIYKRDLENFNSSGRTINDIYKR